jgi:hypothetical protein
MSSILNEGHRERKKEREQESDSRRKREMGARSAVSRINGCNQIFYKDLNITGNMLTQFYKYADVCRRTGTKYMQVNEVNLFIT